MARKKPFQNPHRTRIPDLPRGQAKKKKPQGLVNHIALVAHGKDTFGYFVTISIDEVRYRFEVDHQAMQRAIRLDKKGYPGKALMIVKRSNHGWERIS